MDIPGFGNDLSGRQHGIGFNFPEHWRVLYRLPVLISGKNGGQVEAEAVDVHLRDPVPKAVADHPAHHRVVGVQGIAGAGKVLIDVVAVFFIKHVVGAVLDAPERKGRPGCISFATVVENHIEDHFDACPVQGFYHIPEFIDGSEWVRRAGIGVVRGKKSNGAVTPVVA